MRNMRRLLVVFGIALVAVVASGTSLDLPIETPVLAQEKPRPTPQDEYVPIDQLPPQQELPAAPMVVAAYSFVWAAFIVYVFTLVKRVRKVETDLARLEHKGR